MIRSVLIRLGNIDRHWIFLLLFCSVLLPMLFPVEMPIIPGKPATSLYRYIDQLPVGTRVYLSFDYDPGSMPEIHPAAVAVLAHLFKKGLKPICGANWPVGGDLAEQAVASASQLFQRSPEGEKKPVSLRKGIDYVNVGFRPGAMVNIKRLSKDFLGNYAVDRDGVPTKNMDIFSNSDGHPFSIQDVGLIVSFSGGALGIEDFISLAGEHGRPLGTACTSINIPLLYTYFQTRQIVGLTGGMPGAAEYEMLVGFRGSAREGMVPQSFAHLVMMLFIVLGNLSGLAKKGAPEPSGGGRP